MANTARQRLADAYRGSDPDEQRRQRLAATYRPERDAEMERIKNLPRLSPQQRVTVGHHEAAKAAAQAQESAKATAHEQDS
jgi:hypothetical protein